MKADIIVDLQLGDTGKGKVTHQLLKGGCYTHCMRYNGSQNAGHTIYHEGNKFVTHGVPAGVFFDIPSIIGSGCAVNPTKLLREVEYLEEGGVNACEWLGIAHNTHIITEEHLNEDSTDSKIGTTRSGNGPAFRDKYARVGKRAEDCPELKDFVMDVYHELHEKNGSANHLVLMEGAQGFFLDPDYGEYPYVTSSHCTVAAALQNGIPFSAVRRVYGTAKAYETYSGFKNYQPEGEIFDKIGDAGNEFGATTGRRRQVNFLNVEELIKAININGVTHLIISKVDVLREVGVWRFRNDVFDRCEEEFKAIVRECIPRHIEIIWSERPDGI